MTPSRYPLFFTELQPPDEWGRMMLRCRLQKQGPLTSPPEIIEELGEIPWRAYPEKSYESSAWMGEEGARYFEVTMPDGRRFEVCATSWVMARGDWPQRVEKPGRAKREKPQPVAQRAAQLVLGGDE